ncbi:MAG TPA: hypothetical protein VMJ10_14990 [Kofleriaceae bacterium]|nr:hypothetical protein [Kofleriaceae bacterium]
MRAAILAALSFAGCYAALPYPPAPRVAGTVSASGGTLGGWQMTPTQIKPVEHLDALDLVDSRAPGYVLRFVLPPSKSVAPPADESDDGDGPVKERLAPRHVELRLAAVAPSGGGPPTEVVLERDHCRVLDAILQAAHDVAFGSARFDCDLGAQGHVSGDVEFAGGGYRAMGRIRGHLEATDTTLAGVRFQIDEGETDPRGVLAWDHRRPRVLFEFDAQPADASILGAASNARLRVTSTAGPVTSFELGPPQCRVFRLDRRDTGYVRVGSDQHTLWAGSIDLDCATPSGGRLTGHLEVSE